MTCIVGLVQGDEVYIGGDSAGVGGYDMTIRSDQKVFRNGDFIMGFTSSFRMGQLLRFSLDVPKRHQDTDVYEYMCTVFIDAVRKCLKDGGYASKKNEEETGGVFLVGYEKRLFRIDWDYQVGEHVDEYAAVGCGESYALGALASETDDLGKQKVKQALAVAEKFSAGVAGPFHIEKL